MNPLQTKIEFLKGVGPKRALLLNKELGIFTFGDLLFHFPFRYVDRSKFHPVSAANQDQAFMQFKGRLRKIKKIGQTRKMRLTAEFYDASGSIELVWFKGIKWVEPKLDTDSEFVLFGKPTRFNGKYNIAHPELELASTAKVTQGRALQPIYHTTEKLSNKNLHSKALEKLVYTLTQQIQVNIPENLTPDLAKKWNLIPRNRALFEVHFPSNAEYLKLARYRLKFEELFFMQLQILRFKNFRKSERKGFIFGQVGPYFKKFYDEVLPFDLTGAQKRVIKEIRADVKSGDQMNRLLQGDVGSGKTIVAVLTILLAIDNGFQAALMAPTEILATQHYEGVSELLDKVGIKTTLLTGSTKAKARTPMLEQLKNGEIEVIIGTHALLEDRVQFKNLGVVIIDEQHRFGVAQRSRMWAKSKVPPHILIMSATPIPRTLAMSFYGDLDVSIIDELPPGRKPIQTIHKYDANRLGIFGFIRKQIQIGRQIYIVYPLIEESEHFQYKDLMDGFESISREFPPPQFQVSIVHGKMKPADKDLEMQRFVNGQTHIMVATTVIEVGVNVPNASVMIIESAEKFGLAQLHQLRGRVGRGAEQSYCILITDYKLSSEARTRIETMVRTNDGFEVAEADLNLRGPGNIMGTQQSGILDFAIADLAKDGKILKVAREAAISVLEQDPNLELPQHHNLRRHFISYVKKHPNWGNIS
ncbi:ATP-dependent DNA helicase RecG [bacterium SCSIO 12643]|nr:ATP-dependent DNA helicase RecG [bacterium SCSIO 12643]